MVQTPDWVRPHINVDYPSCNKLIFEEWFYENYDGDVSEREYLPIFFTSYQVNNSYGQDKVAMQRLQDYVDTLPNDKKYHTSCQYDDGVGVDWKGKDVLEFNMHCRLLVNHIPINLVVKKNIWQILSAQ
jgi:hypothetical protein